MNAVTDTTVRPKLDLRTLLSSTAARDAGIAACAALALAAAFPKFGAAWLVPFGIGALFWVWQGASWKRAALLGWFAGLIFFALDFRMGRTHGRSLYRRLRALSRVRSRADRGAVFRTGRHAWLPSPTDACIRRSHHWERQRHSRSASGCARSAHSRCRSTSSGYTQADSPLRAIAAYAGTYGITFALCVLGAYGADALRRQTWRPFGIAVAAVIVATAGAWAAWPARNLAPATITSRGDSRQHRAVVQVELARARGAPLHGDDARRG